MESSYYLQEEEFVEYKTFDECYIAAKSSNKQYFRIIVVIKASEKVYACPIWFDKFYIDTVPSEDAKKFIRHILKVEKEFDLA